MTNRTVDMPARTISLLTFAAALLIASCGDEVGEKASSSGSESRTLVLRSGDCLDGGSPERVAAEPVDGWPRPPEPELVIDDSRQCGRLISFCPPWIKNCGQRLPLFVPEKALEIRQGDTLVVDFGSPIEQVSEQIGIRTRCETGVVAGDDPARVELVLPDYIWSENPRRCGRSRNLTGSLSVRYGPDGTFAGYNASFGVYLAIKG